MRWRTERFLSWETFLDGVSISASFMGETDECTEAQGTNYIESDETRKRIMDSWYLRIKSTEKMHRFGS